MGNKIIRISTDNEISIHDYKNSNEYLQALIGCRIFEHVIPGRLYSELGVAQRISVKRPGKFVSMLVDEEGRLIKAPKINTVGSYLYEMDIYNHPIMGNILFVGEAAVNGDIDFCGIDDEVFKDIHKALKALCEKAKEIR